MSEWTILGPYIAGEIPETWVHQFLDADGNAINLAGYTVKVAYKLDGGTQVLRSATLYDGATGKGSYTWVAGDTSTAGLLQGEMWCGNGSVRYARSFEMRIIDAKGGTAPSI